ncbi:secretogranin-2 [Oncorhynchus tshawytscha]|uniref:Secretogranin II n=2 Tax=Oncorhynchus tshawytscha TaxID=74940 RepID=A0AAZ3PAZ5_ONCTS|nr:secretogranin-2 [Oncorhynchus tshawytscha]
MTRGSGVASYIAGSCPGAENRTARPKTGRRCYTRSLLRSEHLAKGCNKMLSLFKLSTGKPVVLAFLLLHAFSVQGASRPRHHRLRGGEAEELQPAVYPPSSDMIKALEYIESLKQRTDGGQEREEPTKDYDEVEKFRILLQLTSLQGEGTPERQSSPPAQRQQDIPAEQLVRALLRTLQEQLASPPRPALVVPGNDRRGHRHPSANTGSPVNTPAYSGFPRPHKKYPLMFEDEEDRDSPKRATEDLKEKYTPQSLNNLRSIFKELGKPSTSNNQKRQIFEDDDDLFSPRNLAYEDVAGGEEWIPVEENVETEEVVNRSHEEFDRALQQNYDEEEEEKDDGMQMKRRAGQNKEDPEEDTKPVDYYLLKILGMSEHETARRQTEEQKKRLIRHPMVDPRALNELLKISLKLHIPPEDLIDMLITEEIRKLDHHPQAIPRYRTSSNPKIRYYSRRLPVKNAPEDMDEEDFLNIVEMETISNDYPVSRRPLKSAPSPPRVSAPPAPAKVLAPAPPPVAAPKVPSSSGRRENLFMSELNKMPFKRESDNDEADEDEMMTFLAAKILTKYPSTISKRNTQSQANGQFPYELYEQAMKDYFDQADTMTKRDSEGNEVVEPAEMQVKDQVPQETAAPETEEEKEPHGKPVAGM